MGATMDAVSLEELEKLIELHQEHQRIKQQQRLRGLNDANIFTTLVPKHYEVHLHSRFLRFLLDPNGNHYQGTLFLSSFLAACKLSDFFSDLTQCQVYSEYDNIDLYITDNSKHIIIENKIYAGDQPEQIRRYVESVKKKLQGDASSQEDDDQEDTPDQVAVIFLSLDKGPSKYSLLDKTRHHGYRVNDSHDLLINTQDETETHPFRSIHYDREITEWLKKAHSEVANITNLSVIITQYQEVIEKLYNKYQEKVMTLFEHIKSKVDIHQYVKSIKSLHDKFPQLRAQYINDFFDTSYEKMQQEMQQDIAEGWLIKKQECDGTHRYCQPIIIARADNQKGLSFIVEFQSGNFHDAIHGVCRGKETKSMQDFFQELPDATSAILNGGKLEHRSEAWLAYNNIMPGDALNYILEHDSLDDASDKFCNKFIGQFRHYKPVILEGIKKLGGGN